MVVRLNGVLHALTEAPFMVSKNKYRNYPVRNVPDNVDGVSYITGAKGRTDITLMTQWLS